MDKDNIIKLFKSNRIVHCDHTYVSQFFGYTMQREEGLTPNGNEIHGRWVLRQNGEWVDFDQFRSDLAERNNLRIV